MKNKTVCIVGGTGFVGHHLVSLLSPLVKQINVISRRRQKHMDLLVLPNVKIIEADIHQTGVLDNAFKNTDIVINLVGILNEGLTKGETFRRNHVELTQKILDACATNKICRLLHMSALNADASQGSSLYLRTKGEAENMAHTFTGSGISVTSFRPSVIFGEDDHFFNRFATILKIAPYFPLACPNTKFSPVYVSDVAQAMIDAIPDRSTKGVRISLCGPKTYTLHELVKYTASLMGSSKWVLPLTDGLSKMQANILQYFPGKPFTPDNYQSLQKDSVCDNDSTSCPTTIESIVPRYIGNEHNEEKLQEFRRKAKR